MKGDAIGDPAEKFRLRDMMIAVMPSISIIRPFRSDGLHMQPFGLVYGTAQRAPLPIFANGYCTPAIPTPARIDTMRKDRHLKLPIAVGAWIGVVLPGLDQVLSDDVADGLILG